MGSLLLLQCMAIPKDWDGKRRIADGGWRMLRAQELDEVLGSGGQPRLCVAVHLWKRVFRDVKNSGPNGSCVGESSKSA